MKKLFLRVGFWLARRGGWTDMAETYRAQLHIYQEQLRTATILLEAEKVKNTALESRLTVFSSPLVDDAKFTVKHVEDKFPDESGEFKRAQALRMLMNRNPEATEKDLAFSIELALR